MYYYVCIYVLIDEGVTCYYTTVIDFVTCKDHLTAYLKLLKAMKVYLGRIHFPVIQEACILDIKGPDVLKFSDEAELISDIRKANEVQSLFLALADSDYWNWFDTHLLEAMVHASDIIIAKQTLKNYEACISKIPLSVVFPSIPVHLFEFRNCTSIEQKFHKTKDKLTVGDIKGYQYHLEKLCGTKSGSVKLHAIRTGCVQLIWLVHGHCT